MCCVIVRIRNINEIKKKGANDFADASMLILRPFFFRKFSRIQGCYLNKDETHKKCTHTIKRFYVDIEIEYMVYT